MNRVDRTLQSCRAGFTLFETMLALALTLVLILAIQSALMLHWKYRTAGAEQTQESLKQLAFLEDIQTDLRLASSGISQTEQAASTLLSRKQNSSPEVSDMRIGPEIRERFLQIEQQATSSQPIGFVGNEQVVAFEVSYPSYRFEKSQFLVPQAKIIVWFVNHGSSIKLPAKRNADVVQWQKVETSQLPYGLIRLELNEHFDSQHSLANQTWELIDPAATAIDFTYLVAAQSAPRWDSVAMQILPNAVSIAISRSDQIQHAIISLPQAKSTVTARRYS